MIFRQYTSDYRSHSTTHTATACSPILFVASNPLKPTQKFISKLLSKPPKQRLGNLSGGIKDLRQNVWFADFDFNAFFVKAMPAPWKPKLKSTTDASRYDPSAFADLHAKFKVVAMDTSAWDKDF